MISIEGLDTSIKNDPPVLFVMMNCELAYALYCSPLFELEKAESLCPIKAPVGAEEGHDVGETIT